MENAGLQMSVGFTCQDDDWSDDGKRREIKQASLHKGDVTVCNFGCNPATDVGLSERASLGLAERRALKGSRERRMCPELDGYELQHGPSLTVARGRATLAVPREVASYLEPIKARREKMRRHTGSGSVERARRARMRRSDASPEGEEPNGPRYTDAEIQKLGEEGKALKKANGKAYHYPIVDGRDVSNAVKAYGRAKPSERPGVRGWIIKRARQLRLDHRLPASWGQVKVKAGPKRAAATEPVL